MFKIVSFIYCLKKDISMAFNAVFISFKCAGNQVVIFYRNSTAGPARGAHYWQLSAIFVNYLEDYL